MLVHARGLAVLFLGLVSVLDAAQGQSVAETAARWGLLGSWRIDCGQPISSSNGDLSYVVRSGMLFHDREFGNTRDSNPVVAATAKRNGMLEITVNFRALSQTRQFSFIKGRDGRIRAIANRNVETDEYTVKDGKLIANGNMTPWQTRCN